ncbi:NUMOD4 motif [Mycobacteroides abscessus subsp. massiliense]|uniref:NUMOD4 motif-containing HNH endonuclease n=1 Tax=Mycobacteroides abscessus TaxID=36809 RepID=UPI0009A874DA|nr:NUMOD4 motif [Mycobacteroides abscessus subsp. massiliense]SKU82497.1 NUMOD4 motif [Mycobacteroides abscessus subsp. massiliense]
MTRNPLSERWLPVPGYEGCYEVSDLGRVRSVDRTFIRRDGVEVTYRGKLLAPNVRDGRHYVHLYRNNRGPLCAIHRLVLEAFIGPRPEGMFGCHANDVPSDNRLVNLRWDTPSGNSRDKVRNGHDHNASKTHCKRGHEFTTENTGRSGSGRYCRECLRDRRAAQRDQINARSRAKWATRTRAERDLINAGQRERWRKRRAA